MSAVEVLELAESVLKGITRRNDEEYRMTLVSTIKKGWVLM